MVRRGETGAIAGEGVIPAEESGLARLVLELGTEVEPCVEMMSGAVWVRDRPARKKRVKSTGCIRPFML